MTFRRAGALVLSAFTFASAAPADVADDVTVVVSRLAALGKTELRPPRLLASRETLPVVLPEAMTAGTEGCTTLAVVSAVSTVFAVRLAGTRSEEAEVLPSVGGGALVVRCGASRRKLEGVTVEMRSPRAVVEIVVGTSRERPPPLATMLPRREPGYVSAPVRPGPPPRSGPVDVRARAFEAALVRDGLPDVSRKVVAAGADGAGRLLINLAPGCHRIGLLGTDAPGDDVVHDLDAELAWVSGDLAASERTDSPDATLFACNAEHDLAVLAYAGAAPRGSVLVIRGRAEIPSGLPPEWGRDARGAMARALFERHLPGPETPPAHASLGVAGLTGLPVEVEPGRCYLAALGVVEGAAKLVALSASLGERLFSSHTEEAGGAAALTFCAGAAERATLSAEVHGASLVWALGLWPLGRRPLGEEAP